MTRSALEAIVNGILRPHLLFLDCELTEVLNSGAPSFP